MSSLQSTDWESVVPGDGYERDCLVETLESYDRECMAGGLLAALAEYFEALKDEDESGSVARPVRRAS